MAKALVFSKMKLYNAWERINSCWNHEHFERINSCGKYFCRYSADYCTCVVYMSARNAVPRILAKVELSEDALFHDVS